MTDKDTIAICRACDKHSGGKKLIRCGVCGCVVAIDTKAIQKQIKRCPIKKF